MVIFLKILMFLLVVTLLSNCKSDDVHQNNGNMKNNPQFDHWPNQLKGKKMVVELLYFFKRIKKPTWEEAEIFLVDIDSSLGTRSFYFEFTDINAQFYAQINPSITDEEQVKEFVFFCKKDNTIIASYIWNEESNCYCKFPHK